MISGSDSEVNMNQTVASANRMHIIVLGACNSGKSSLVNMLTGQHTSLVSDIPGTTTDPVFKPMELPGLGACVLIDTAGFNDVSDLGERRIASTRQVLERADIAILLTGHDTICETEWRQELDRRKIPVVEVVSKADLRGMVPEGTVVTSINRPTESRDCVIEALLRAMPSDSGDVRLLRGLVDAGDIALLVMPQDSQAPVGRLILPQVQTIRELLDRGCVPVCCTPATMPRALEGLSSAPALVITDSQVFKEVYAMTPPGSRLTSFSILMAAYKGDIDYFVESASALDALGDGNRVLIAESCTHAPKNEDIGRVKIPAMLRRKVGEGLVIDFVRGKDFPDDLTPYSLVIHCGGCMFNRRHILSRVARAREQCVPMTNYGILLARLSGILDKVVY